MTRRRFPAAAVVLAAAAAAAFAGDPPAGRGTPAPAGTNVVTEIDDHSDVPASDATDDRDAYVFDGYQGQVLSVAAVRAPSRDGAALPELELFRPDGSLVLPADGLRQTPQPGAPATTASKCAFRLDATGAWTIRVRGGYASHRVRGDDPATPATEKWYVVRDYEAGRTEGPYRLTVRASAPPQPKSRGVLPDDAGHYDFAVPGAAGASLSATATFTGAAPAFVAVLDPSGKEVDGFTARTTKQGRLEVSSPLALDGDRPFGTYRFRFATPAGAPPALDFDGRVRFGKSAKPLRGRMSGAEPRIDQVTPPVGGPDVQVLVRCTDAADSLGKAVPRIRIGRFEIANPDVATAGRLTTFRFQAPDAARLLDGSYDVTVLSSSGQAAVLAGGFRVAPPPRVFSMEPTVGNAAGGFEIRITGADFADDPLDMEIRYIAPGSSASIVAPVTFKTGTGPGVLVFDQPTIPPFSGTQGDWRVLVADRRSERTAEAPTPLTLITTALVAKVLPEFVPVTGGVTLTLKGGNFRPSDRVFLETSPGGGVFEEITASQTTYVSEHVHRFLAPDRSPLEGAYRVRVIDAEGDASPERSVALVRLEPATARFGLNEADGYDGVTSALADFDLDGDTDLVIARRGGASAEALPQARVFLADANGRLTDATTAVMPAASAADDWRAEKVVAADVDADGYTDLLLLSSTATIPAAETKSHLRILRNERRSALLPVAERAFRDRTGDLMAPPRPKMMSPAYGTTKANQGDDWAGKDLWVGDLDLSGAGPPELVVTTDRVFENVYVTCAPYCASPFSGGYPYSFYWGGTRVFRWDAAARGGLGRYRFDAAFMPRRAAIAVPIFNPPPGIYIPTCAGNGECRGTFTPFAGKRLAVGALDIAVTGATGKARPDIAVVSDQPVVVKSGTISSLQVALNEPSATDGSAVTDVTDRLTALGAADQFRGDAVAIGAPFADDGDAYGVIALAKRDASGLTGSESALRLLKFAPPADPKDRAVFTDVSGLLPAAGAADRFHAAVVAFYDVDRDGRPDLVTLAPSSPGGAAALRLLRNDLSGSFTRKLDTDLVAPVVTGQETWEGEALAIGDLDGDGAPEFLVTRASGTAPNTRVLATKR